MRVPLRRAGIDSNVRSGAERPRTIVKIAIRPPGVSTRGHAVERAHRVVEQVQRGEAADGVEALVAERQVLGVAAHVGDVVVQAGGLVSATARAQHRLDTSMPDRRAPRARRVGRSRA